MRELIPISSLNDFLFCPYSLYLHQVYRGTAEEETVKATPQLAGTAAHLRKETDSTGDQYLITSLPVLSKELGIQGVIDELDIRIGTLTEYKNNVKTIYPGQVMQLHGQYYCLTEQRYDIRRLFLTEISSGTKHEIPLPDKTDLSELKKLIQRIQNYTPEQKIDVNPTKCRKCIYCQLCEKSEMENDF